MPRKAKEKLNTQQINDIPRKKVAKSVASRKTSKVTASEKTVEHKNGSKKSTTTSPKSNTAKKSGRSSSSIKATQKPLTTVEYYDLPFRYNQTVVKVLAQTPTTLFIYWDISDEDKLNYQKQYGEGFFNNSKPVLIVTNETMNYTFKVEINDFANSWYLHVNDADCKYKIELIREMITNHENISIASSNEMDSPNDHILFEKLGNAVFFRDTKTNFVQEENITSISRMQNIGKIYNIYENIEPDTIIGNKLNITLPSSR